MHVTKGNYYQRENKLEIFGRSVSKTGAKVWNLLIATGETLLNLLSREKIADFFPMFSWIGRAMLNSTP